MSKATYYFEINGARFKLDDIVTITTEYKIPMIGAPDVAYENKYTGMIKGISTRSNSINLDCSDQYNSNIRDIILEYVSKIEKLT